MSFYTYKVIPAPGKAPKLPGVKAPDARFALGLEATINEMARAGWEYLRADILPSEERQGLTSTQTVYRSVLVFRRSAEPGEAMAQAEAEETPTPPAPPVHMTEDRGGAPSLGAAGFAAKAAESLRRIPPLAGAKRRDTAPDRAPDQGEPAAESVAETRSETASEAEAAPDETAAPLRREP